MLSWKEVTEVEGPKGSIVCRESRERGGAHGDGGRCLESLAAGVCPAGAEAVIAMRSFGHRITSMSNPQVCREILQRGGILVDRPGPRAES